MSGVGIPEQILEDLSWAFVDEPYASREDFEEAVRQNELLITGSDDRWKPREVVLSRGSS